MDKPGKIDCGPGVIMSDPGRPGKIAAILYVPAEDDFMVLRGASLVSEPERSACLVPSGQPPTVVGTPPEPDEVKQTIAESLRESAKKEREYGQKCLSLADTLERLAAEGEKKGGNSDAH